MIGIEDGHDYAALSAREFEFVLVDGFAARGRAGVLDLLPLIARRAAAGDGRVP